MKRKLLVLIVCLSMVSSSVVWAESPTGGTTTIPTTSPQVQGTTITSTTPAAITPQVSSDVATSPVNTELKDYIAQKLNLIKQVEGIYNLAKTPEEKTTAFENIQSIKEKIAQINELIEKKIELIKPKNEGNDSGQVDEANKDGQVDEANKDGKVDEVSKDGQVDEANKDGKVDEVSKDGQVDEVSKDGQVNEANKDGKVDEVSKDGQVDEASKDGKVDENNNDKQGSEVVTQGKLDEIVNSAIDMIAAKNAEYEEGIVFLKIAIETGDKKELQSVLSEYEGYYKERKDEDKGFYESLNYVKEMAKENPNLELPKNIEDAYNAYVHNRELIKQFHDMIQGAKENYFKEKLERLNKKIELLQKLGNIDEAIKNYEQVLETTNNETTIEKLKDLYKQKHDNQIKVYVNGKKPDFDVQPFVKDGRTLVPIRQIAEALDAKVQWDDATKTITITKGDKVIKLTVDSNVAKIGKKDITIDAPATIYNERTVVPLRFVSEAFDSQVNWDDATKMITVEDKNE